MWIVVIDYNDGYDQEFYGTYDDENLANRDKARIEQQAVENDWDLVFAFVAPLKSVMEIGGTGRLWQQT